MNKNKVKCILFDVDGVIVTSGMFSLEYQKNHKISNKEMLVFFTGAFQDCLVGKADLKIELKKLLSKWKWEGTVNELLAFWFEFENKVDQRVVKKVKLLKEQGVKCYLATKQEHYRTKYMKEVMNFDKLFDGIFSSADIGYKKPEKEFYQVILKDLKKKHDIETGEIIFFDDDQKNIDGAGAVGIKSYLYKNFEGFEEVIKEI